MFTNNIFYNYLCYKIPIIRGLKLYITIKCYFLKGRNAEFENRGIYT